MFNIPCPHCGPRADIEFSYARALEGAYAHESAAALFTRENPIGMAEEIWQHTRGCRAWLIISRNRSTHEILGVRPSPRDAQ